MTTDAATTLALLRRHTSPGMVLGQRLAGGGCTEVAASGSWVTLSDGTRMLDLGSYAVTTIGHRHPDVIAAVTDQLGRLPTSTRSLPNDTVAEFAAKLTGYVAIDGLDRVWMDATGAGAVECALKLARLATKRDRILAVANGYHGKTLGALAATSRPALHTGLENCLAPTTHLDPDDPDAARKACAHRDVAALIFEPIQGEGGIRRLDEAILRRWSRDAREAGALVIADEIQCGLLRAGHPILSRHADIPVDAILLGKALGGGVMPLSAVVASSTLYRPMRDDPLIHSSTFGGHPLSCAAGIAALDVLTAAEHSVSPVAASFEATVRDCIAASGRHDIGVRGSGLMWGLVVDDPAIAGALMVELFRCGIVMSPCLTTPTVLRLLPGLTFGEPEQEFLAIALRAALASVGTEGT